MPFGTSCPAPVLELRSLSVNKTVKSIPASIKAEARIRKLVPAQEMKWRMLYAGC